MLRMALPLKRRKRLEQHSRFPLNPGFGKAGPDTYPFRKGNQLWASELDTAAKTSLTHLD